MSASDEEAPGPGKAFEGSKKKDIDRSLKEKKWEEVQIKAFTSWMNSMLSNRDLSISNLKEDLRDGLNLVAVLEIAAGKVIKGIKRNPTIKIQMINNLDLGLKFMAREFHVRIELFSAEDIYDGNQKIILGMLFSLFRKVGDVLMEKMGRKGDDDSSEAGLLNWIREMTAGYRDVNIVDFKTSFNDGMAFAALAHKFDNDIIDYDSLQKENKEENLDTAFDTAEKHLHIPKLLDPQDLIAEEVDERSVILYASLYFHAFVSNEERIKQREKEQQTGQVIHDIKNQLATVSAELEECKKERDAAGEENASLLARIKELEEQVAFLRKKAEVDAESIDLLEQQVAMLNSLLEKERGEKSQAEASRGRILEEMEELRVRSEEEARYSEEEREEMKKRLHLLEEQEEKVRREREDARRRAEETAEDFERSLEEAESRKANLLEEISKLRDSVRDEMSRRRRKEAEAEKLAAENAALKQKIIIQSRARSGLSVLKRNLEEHLEDMYKWRELHHGQVEENRFDLAEVVKATEGKTFDEQVGYLDGRLQEENRSLLRIVQLQDSHSQLQDKIDKEGSLRMKFRKDWRERWFRVSGNKLSWYENEEAGRREGAVDLTKHCDIVRQKAVKAEDGGSNKLWPLKLTVQHEGQDKKLFIRAASKRERHAWFSLISSKIANINYIKAASETGNRPDTRVLSFLSHGKADEIVLDGRKVYAEGVTAIAKVIPGRDTLHSVSIRNAELADEHLAPLTDPLQRALALKHVNLSGNQLTSASVGPFVEKLGGHGRFVSLHLDHNKIDAEGAAAIAQAVAGCAELKELSVDNNPIGTGGAAALSESLSKAAGITSVSFAGCNLDDGAAGPLVALLNSEDSALTSLDLSHNALGDTAVAAICDALGGNTSLHVLDLSHNSFGPAGAQAIRSLLAANKDIVTVRLSGNKLRGTDALSNLLTNESFTFPDLSFTRSAN